MDNTLVRQGGGGLWFRAVMHIAQTMHSGRPFEEVLL